MLNKFSMWPEAYEPYLTNCGMKWIMKRFSEDRNQTNIDCGHLGNGLNLDVMSVLLRDLDRSNIPFKLIHEQYRPNLTYGVADFLREENYYMSEEEMLSNQSENLCTFPEWIESVGRSQKAQASYPVYQSSQGILYSVESHSKIEHESWFSYLDVFQMNIWILLASIFITVRILRNVRVKISDTRIVSINRAYFTAVAFLIAMVQALYRSSLLSNLLIQEQRIWLSNLEEFTTKWQSGDAEFVFNSGSSAFDMLKHHKSVWEQIMIETRPTEVDTFGQMIEYIDSSPRKAFSVVSEMSIIDQSLIHTNLRRFIIPELPKHTVLFYCTNGTTESFMELLNRVIVRNTEEINAIYISYESSMYVKSARQAHKLYKRYLRSMNLNHFIDNLVLLGIGTFVSLCVFGFELVFYLCSSKKNAVGY